MERKMKGTFGLFSMIDRERKSGKRLGLFSLHQAQARPDQITK